MKSKEGQTLALSLLTSLFVLIAGVIMLNFLLPEIDIFRTSLSCSDVSSISNGTKVLCLISDATIPYWIVLVFSLVVGGITSRLRI